MTNLSLLAEAFERHRVEWVLVGGMALALHGGEYTTFDLDADVRLEEENIRRLADALEELEARPLRWGGGQFRLELTDLASGSLHLTSRAGALDVLVRTPGTGFEDLAHHAERVEVGPGAALRLASLEDLLRMKETADRPRDRLHVEQIKLLIEERQRSERQK